MTMNLEPGGGQINGDFIQAAGFEMDEASGDDTPAAAAAPPTGPRIETINCSVNKKQKKNKRMCTESIFHFYFCQFLKDDIISTSDDSIDLLVKDCYNGVSTGQGRKLQTVNKNKTLGLLKNHTVENLNSSLHMREFELGESEVPRHFAYEFSEQSQM